MKKTEGSQDFGLGTVVVWSEKNEINLTCDRTALTDDGELKLLSVVGANNQVKAIRAMLGKNDKEHVRIGTAGLRFVKGETVRRSSSWHFLSRCQHGYKCHVERLDYGMAHAIFLSRDPDFLPNVSGESLWHTLGNPRYSTPILRHWMYWITKQLIQNESLVYTFGHRCKCGTLRIDSDGLDRIVSEGLKTGQIGFYSKRETQ